MSRLVFRALKALFLVFFATVTAYAAEEQPANVEDIAVRFTIALYGQDFDTAAELAAPDMVFESPTSPPGLVPTVRGREAVMDAWGGELSEMDQEMNISRSFASHDKAVLYVTTEGTAGGEFFGHEAKKVAYKTEGVVVIQIVDGLVVRYSGYMDYPATLAGLRPVE